jgi:hypothetical protein
VTASPTAQDWIARLDVADFELADRATLLAGWPALT